MSQLNVRGTTPGVVGLIVALAACGSVSTSQPDAKAEPAQPKPSASPEPLVSGICLYHQEGADPTVRHLLQIRVSAGEQFDGGRLFPTRKALSGLGDKALEGGSTTRHRVDIQFVKGGKTGTINDTTGASADIGSRVPALVAIVKKLAASM